MPAQAPAHKTGTAHLADTANAQSLQAHRQKLDRHLVQNGPNNGNVQYDPKTSSLKPRDNWVK